ncbi:hypothetical protein CDAR_281071 [Caerostris darwini]|uniref:Uncharacterized protein n=1 Tax=Caerostris darwini TaxID=1538125 RepID=A0AAV4NEM2_9ARAC|nr:hypothetical protein CDAR_281071 [Caerostris darwini]
MMKFARIKRGCDVTPGGRGTDIGGVISRDACRGSPGNGCVVMTTDIRHEAIGEWDKIPERYSCWVSYRKQIPPLIRMTPSLFIARGYLLSMGHILEIALPPFEVLTYWVIVHKCDK